MLIWVIDGLNNRPRTAVGFGDIPEPCRKCTWLHESTAAADQNIFAFVWYLFVKSNRRAILPLDLRLSLIDRRHFVYYPYSAPSNVP